MKTTATPQSPIKNKKTALWIGRILSGICVLFLLFDSLMKILRSAASVEGTAGLGLPDDSVRPLGLLILFFTVLYCIPRSALFGALLLTAHLGGAVAIFVQQFHGEIYFLFPLIFCIMVWIGLYLRDERLWSILPLSKL